MQCQGLQIEVKDVSEAQWIVYQEFAFARFFLQSCFVGLLILYFSYRY